MSTALDLAVLGVADFERNLLPSFMSLKKRKEKEKSLCYAKPTLKCDSKLNLRKRPR